jgi:hypothetical protein
MQPDASWKVKSNEIRRDRRRKEDLQSSEDGSARDYNQWTLVEPAVPTSLYSSVWGKNAYSQPLEFLSNCADLAPIGQDCKRLSFLGS